MIKSISMTLALALAGTALPALAQTPPPPPPPEAKMQAQPYVMAAGKSDLYEINSSQIAVDKSQNPAVKRYAQMLITHHQKTGLAPPPPPALDPGATASINELQSAAPGDFDRIYLGQQVPAHQAALDLHKSYGKGGDQAPLRTSAKKAVPIVQQHLTAAERMLKTAHAGHKGM
jgi:putative membrane protein